METEQVSAVPVPGDIDLLSLHQIDPKRYPYLLQSTRVGGQLGRYDILFAFPGKRITQLIGSGDRFLEQLDLEYRLNSIPDAEQKNKLPFSGGWFLFLSYELAGEIERLPSEKTKTEIPLAVATRIPAAVIRDHSNRQTWILIEQDHRDANEMLDALKYDLANLAPRKIEQLPKIELIEEPPQEYLEAVSRAKDYIREGDIFQANLSREWRAVLDGQLQADNLYARLRHSNPAPFAGLARIDDDLAVVSSSPERLISIGTGAPQRMDSS